MQTPEPQMTHIWPYNGSLDETEKFLTLDSEGPSFADDGTMAKYQDIIEFLSHDHRMLSSQYLGPNGQWIPFMKAHYQRRGGIRTAHVWGPIDSSTSPLEYRSSSWAHRKSR